MQHAWICLRTSFSPFFMTVWLKANYSLAQSQAVDLHTLNSLMCVNEKIIDTILVITIMLTCGQYRSKKKESVQVFLLCPLYSHHVRFTLKEQNDNHTVVVEQVVVEEEDLVAHKVPLSKDLVAWKITLSGYCPKHQQYWWWVTMRKFLMSSQCFTTENTIEMAESMVGAYRAESTDPWTAAKGITSKIPPLFNGSTSWFKYEKLIDDWLDLTVLEERKRGTPLKNGLFGDAKMHKGLLNRESVRAEDGVKYFRDITPFHQKSSEYFLEILSIYQSKKRKHWDGQVDRRVWQIPGWICYRYPSWARNEEKISISLTWPERLKVEATRDHWHVTQVAKGER